MDPDFGASLNATLEQLIAPDTSAIKAATVRLNQHFYKNSQCVPALFEIAINSPNLAIRQLALVELRKRVQAKRSKQWLAQPLQIRQTLKARLLDLCLESTDLVRNAAARLIASLARLELNAGTWPELLPWLWQLSSSPSAMHREVAMQTLYMLLDTIILGTTVDEPDDDADGGIARFASHGAGTSNAEKTIEEHIPQLLQMFRKTIVDPESLAVRVWTVRSIGKVQEYIEAEQHNEVQIVQELVPGMMGVIHQCLEESEENHLKSCFDIIETLTLAETNILTPHTADVVRFLLTAAANPAYDPDMRIMCLNALLWVVKFKKSKIQALNIAGDIIAALLPIGAEEEPTESDEDAPARCAFRVIDTLATSLPPNQVFPPLFDQVRAFSQSPDAGRRKSAISAFGVVIEGCSLYIQPHLDSLWPLITTGLADPDVTVRKASCSALGYLCDMLGEDCARQHATLLPLISNLISDPATQKSAIIALDCFLENLGKDIEPYIPQLMDALVQLLDAAPLSLKGAVVGAIGSAAHASKTAFQPYFDASITRILPYLNLTEPGEELELRGVVQDTLGTLAEAVGKDAFRPYFQPLMDAAIKATAVGDNSATHLKESSYIFFAVVSRVYGEEMQPYLPTIMPILLAAVGQSEIDEEALLGLATAGGTAGFDATDAVSAPNGVGGGGDDDDDDDFEDIDDDESIDSAIFGASTAIALEKEYACDAISEVFAHVKAPFLPYLESSVNALLPSLAHPWHDGIRKSATSTLLGFVATFHQMSQLPKWTGSLNPQPLPTNLQQLIGAIMQPIMDMWVKEDEREVVHEVCSSLSSTLMQVGPALIVPAHLEEICKLVVDILQGRALCQMTGDEDEDEEPGVTAEVSEYDAALIGSALDLVGTLATALGRDFSQLYQLFVPHMVKYYDSARPVNDRSTAIGTLAEVVNGLGGAVTPHTDDFYNLFLAAMNDPEAEVRSNAAFALGSLVFQTEADLSGRYMQVLGALQPAFAGGTQDGAALDNLKDNACGAVGRMLIKNANALPLDQVLPVFFGALPLRRDYAETEKAFKATFKLLREQNPIAIAHLDHLLAVYARALASLSAGFFPETEGAEMAEDVKNELVELLRALNASQPDKIAAAGLTQYL